MSTCTRTEPRCFGPSGGSIVALVKPQFEAGRGATNRGVVRDPAVHRQVLEDVARHAADIGLVPLGVVASPLLGPQGNREFFLHLGVGHPRVGGQAAGLLRVALGEAIGRVTGG